jgi:hypothetical protein
MPAWFLAEAVAPEVLGSIGMDYFAADAAASAAASALGSDVAAGSLGDMLAAQGFGDSGLGALTGAAGAEPTLAELLAKQPGFGGDESSGLMGWWKGLSDKQKMMMGGGLGLAALMAKERRQYGTPPPTGYSGPLNYFKYNPSTYQPAIAVAPTAYSPKYAGGGDVQGDGTMMRAPGAMSIDTMDPVVRMAQGGGIASLGSYSDGGRLLKGPGDGMSDNIPATIGRKQPARLADGEFVVPADVVSGLGNGSTDAGAKQLYKMLSKVRAARTGTKRQGKEINPQKYLPE